MDNRKGVEICCIHDEDRLEVELCGNQGTDDVDPCDSMSIFYDMSLGFQCDECCFHYDEDYSGTGGASP